MTDIYFVVSYRPTPSSNNVAYSAGPKSQQHTKERQRRKTVNGGDDALSQGRHCVEARLSEIIHHAALLELVLP
jgi:hypothetical protein